MKSQRSASTTSNSASGLIAPTHQQISQRAEELWRQQGCPADRDDAIWLEAERQLQSGDPAPVAAKSPTGARRTSARNGGSSTPAR